MIIPNIETLSQEEIIGYHLIHAGNISSKEASDEYGITRLAAVIWELRHRKQWNIISIKESGKNRFGKTVIWVRYYLAEEQR